MPIENALTGMPGVKTIRSKSVLGLSSVVLILEAGRRSHGGPAARAGTAGTIAAQLPACAQPPVMLSPLSSLSRVLKIGVSSKTLSQTEMTTLVRWTIRPRLMAMPGVANVAIWGQRDRQLQVLVDPDRLQANHVSLDEVRAGGAATASRSRPAASSTRRISASRSRMRRGVRSAADLAGLVVTRRDGAPLRVGDVATVVEGHQAPIGDAIINDVPGLLLIVEKQLGANTLEVTRDVEAALETLKPALGDLESIRRSSGRRRSSRCRWRISTRRC